MLSVIDPIYAIAIGTGAALVRIRREEKEKGRTRTDSVASVKRRVNMLFEKEDATAAIPTKGS